MTHADTELKQQMSTLQEKLNSINRLQRGQSSLGAASVLKDSGRKSNLILSKKAHFSNRRVNLESDVGTKKTQSNLRLHSRVGSASEADYDNQLQSVAKTVHFQLPNIDQ